MTNAMTTSAATLPSAIQSLFDKARAVAKSISDIAQDRDKAEVSLAVARDNFDSEPSRKSLDAIARSRAELERLAEILPDDAAAIAEAHARIFSSPEAWTCLSDALSAHAEKYDVAAKIARSAFADSMKNYVLSGGTSPTLTHRNEFGGIAVDAARLRMNALEDRKNYLTGQSNRCHHAAAGQTLAPGETFATMAELLNSQP